MLSNILECLLDLVYVLITYTYFMLPVIKMGSLYGTFQSWKQKKVTRIRGLVNSVGVPTLWNVLGVKSCFTDGTE
jgi:hypothetical protein